MIGEPVEGALDHRLVFEIARRGAEPGEKSAAELVAGEQPVQTGDVDLYRALNDAATWAGQGAGGLDGSIARLDQLLR